MRWCGLAICLVLPVAAAGQECDGADTTLAMGVCLQAELEKADSALNASYGLAMAAFDNGEGGGAAGAAALRAAQRAWISYRDLACASEAALYEGGSMAGIAKTGCLLRLTQERITGLSDFLPN